MVSFRKRNNLWQAQVRNKHIGSITKSFRKKIRSSEMGNRTRSRNAVW